MTEGADGPLHVIARVGDRRLGLAVPDVVEVLPMLEVTRPPGGSSDRAWITLRGRPVPVVCLRAAFALPPAADDVDHRVVLVQGPDGVVGLQVDEVHAVAHVLNVRPAGEGPGLVRAVGVVDGQVCQLLDAASLALAPGRPAR